MAQRLKLGGDEITWEEFEQFCAALLSALPGVVSANRYGGPGEKQDGIDIEITYADGRGGGCQCRQRKEKFGKGDLNKAISENEYEADIHLVLTSGVATKPAREEVKKHPDWELKDIDDLGGDVRLLPRVVARWLVEDFLGSEQRRSFLGPDAPLTLAHWERAYAHLLDPARLFNHGARLVGREGEFKALVEGLEADPPSLIIAPGRGGTGKSRLLLEVAQEVHAEDRPVLFAVEGAQLSAQSLEAELPAGPAVLVIDDAHRRHGIEDAVGYVIRRGDIQLVLSTRPQGVELLRSRAVMAGADTRQIQILPELAPLSGEDSETLAAEVGEEVSEEALHALGRSTRDCQLITVLGARLLAEKKLAIGKLANDEELRSEILARFRSEKLGEVAEVIPPEKARELLPLIAAVQPIADGEEVLLDAIAAEIGSKPVETKQWLEELERCGLLLRVGRLRRIVPDVLGDYVLEERCLDTRGKPTGFSDILFARFGELTLSRLLRNLAELDWRVRSQGDPTILLGTFWQDFLDLFEEADAYGREKLLGTIERVAVYNPEEVLAVAEVELARPAKRVSIGKGVDWSTETVRRRLSALIRDAGYSIDHTEAAMRLLWQLGREDTRPENQFPDHPVRLLKELGSYEHPLPYAAALLNVARVLIAEDSGAPVQPVGLLPPLLERELLSTYARGAHGYTMQPHLIDAQKAAAERNGALELLAAELTGGMPRAAAAAASVLTEALSVPHGFLGQEVPREAVDQWEPEQLEILRLLGDALAAGPAPTLSAQLRSALKRQVEHGQWPAARALAQEILKANQPDLHEKLVALMEAPWSDFKEGAQLQEEVAGELIAEAKGPKEAASALECALADTTEEATPEILLGIFRRLDPRLAKELLGLCIADPDRALARFGEQFLVGNRQELPAELFESTHPTLRRVLSAAYAVDPHDLSEKDVHLLRGLLVDDDLSVSHNAVLALVRLAEIDYALFLELAAAARPRGHQLGQLLHSINPEDASEDQLRTFLGWLREAPQLDYEGGQFLCRAACRLPEYVSELLITRAMSEGSLAEFREVPPLFESANTDSREKALAMLVEAAGDRGVRWRLAYLFHVFTGDDFGAGIAALENRLVDSDEERAASAASLLQNLPAGVVFAQADQFADLLNRAKHPSVLAGHLRAAAISGTISRSPGKPAPEHESRLAGAAKAAQRGAAGSVAAAFYESLRLHFEAEIKDDLRQDEEEEWL